MDPMSKVASDIEIAQAASKLPIQDIAAKLDISADDIGYGLLFYAVAAYCMSAAQRAALQLLLLAPATNRFVSFARAATTWRRSIPRRITTLRVRRAAALHA